MNEERVEKMLEDTIRRKLELLKEVDECEDGSVTYANGVRDVEVLYRLRIDEKKAEAERKQSERANKAESLERKFKLAVDIGAVVLPLALYRWLIIKGFEFETSGTITSPTFKGLWNKIRPR